MIPQPPKCGDRRLKLDVDMLLLRVHVLLGTPLTIRPTQGLERPVVSVVYQPLCCLVSLNCLTNPLEYVFGPTDRGVVAESVLVLGRGSCCM